MKTIGLILAGGQSLRMGQDKASIVFEGKTLLDHARALLAGLGVDEVITLGRPDEPDGHADAAPFEGPAVAIYHWLQTADLPIRIVAIPVDMPLLTPQMLSALLLKTPGGYFDDLYLPLTATVEMAPKNRPYRMRDLLADLRLICVTPQPDWLDGLQNLNNPVDLTLISAKTEAS